LTGLIGLTGFIGFIGFIGFFNSFYPVHLVNPVKFLSVLRKLNNPDFGTFYYSIYTKKFIMSSKKCWINEKNLFNG